MSHKEIIAINKEAYTKERFKARKEQLKVWTERNIKPLWDKYLNKSHFILDIGAGDSAVLQFLGVKVCTALDLHEKILELNPYIRKIGNAEDLPFEDGKFDFILIAEVVEHLENPEKVLSEAHRVLMPNGYLLVTTPNEAWARPHDKKDPLHINLVNMIHLVGMILSAGFNIIEIKGEKLSVMERLALWRKGIFGNPRIICLAIKSNVSSRFACLQKWPIQNSF